MHPPDDSPRPFLDRLLRAYHRVLRRPDRPPAPPPPHANATRDLLDPPTQAEADIGADAAREALRRLKGGAL